MSAGYKPKFEGRDIVSIRDLNIDDFNIIFEVAEKMVPIAQGTKKSDLLAGKILATLFYEPSTRTRLSFECAMHRLGGSVLGFSAAQTSSVVKGETLADTIKMVDAYSDIIVIRHSQEGSARLAAQFSSKPVVNAGDGAGQHPTQTLLDLFTIKTEKNKIDGNHIVFVGDMKYGRTVHSLVYALTMFDISLTFVSPPTLKLPVELKERLEERKINFKEVESLSDTLGDADVLYMTRIQKERFPDPAEYLKVANIYRLDAKLLEYAKKSMIVMHPLPRVNEIAPEVDATHHAVYFKQAFNGVPVRMAILSLLTGAV
jgi:aspartate carbamoyltransferase catalytic subunit